METKELKAVDRVNTDKNANIFSLKEEKEINNYLFNKKTSEYLNRVLDTFNSDLFLSVDSEDTEDIFLSLKEKFNDFDSFSLRDLRYKLIPKGILFTEEGNDVSYISIAI